MTKGSSPEVTALIERIRAAGYACEINGSGHWQVTGTAEAGEEGRMYGTFSATPTSSRSLLNSMIDLRRTTGKDFRIQRRTPPKGERAVPTEPDPRRLALLADRNRNAKALEDAEARAVTPADIAELKAVLESPERQPTKEELDQQAVDRAVAAAMAQPPGRGFKKYPVEQPPRKVTFTVAEMQRLLDESVCNTRPVQPSVVATYRALMRKGLWHVTHQGVAVDWHGCLVDGRQRFTAAIREDMELTVYATYGVDPATFFAMDRGKNRTAPDAISIAGVTWTGPDAKGRDRVIKPNRTAMAAAVTMCMNLDHRHPETGEPMTRYQVEHTAYSHEEIVRALAVMHEDGIGYDPGEYYNLGYYTGIAAQLKREAKLTATAGYVGVFMTHRAYPQGPHEAWRDQLVTGANLGERSPALKLRRALANAADAAERPGSRGGLTTLAQYSLYVKAWNFFVTGRDVQQLRWREDEDIPEPVSPATRRWVRG